MAELDLIVEVAPVWASVHAMRERIASVLADCPLELCLAVTMATSELLENAVKYGEAVPAAPGILFVLSARDGWLQLKTLNGSRDPLGVSRVRNTIEQIANSLDPQALYLRMIAEAAQRPAPKRGGGLGLYRMAAEGHFSLSCHYEGEVVTVVARRSQQ